MGGKIQRATGLKTVQIGEIIPMMTEEFEKGFWACVKKNKRQRKPYFIFFTADWYRNGEELRTTFTAFRDCPPKMLNTGVWKIDNVAGSHEELWMLPKDAPTQPVETDGIIKSIAKAAKGLPLFYPNQELN